MSFSKYLLHLFLAAILICESALADGPGTGASQTDGDQSQHADAISDIQKISAESLHGGNHHIITIYAPGGGDITNAVISKLASLPGARIEPESAAAAIRSGALKLDRALVITDSTDTLHQTQDLERAVEFIAATAAKLANKIGSTTLYRFVTRFGTDELNRLRNRELIVLANGLVVYVDVRNYIHRTDLVPWQTDATVAFTLCIGLASCIRPEYWNQIAGWIEKNATKVVYTAIRKSADDESMDTATGRFIGSTTFLALLTSLATLIMKFPHDAQDLHKFNVMLRDLVITHAAAVFLFRDTIYLSTQRIPKIAEEKLKLMSEKARQAAQANPDRIAYLMFTALFTAAFWAKGRFVQNDILQRDFDSLVSLFLEPKQFVASNDHYQTLYLISTMTAAGLIFRLPYPFWRDFFNESKSSRIAYSVLGFLGVGARYFFQLAMRRPLSVYSYLLEKWKDWRTRRNVRTVTKEEWEQLVALAEKTSPELATAEAQLAAAVEAGPEEVDRLTVRLESQVRVLEAERIPGVQNDPNPSEPIEPTGEKVMTPVSIPGLCKNSF